MTAKKYRLQTSHGELALRESAGTGMPVMMIHGNSSMGEVFRNQFDGAIGAKYRLIAVDLPGHGESADAIDPERSYSMPGYADAMTEVLNKLDVPQAAIFGWSLGGHIGLEMIGLYRGMLGLMITGTPPIAAEDLSKGFRTSPHMGLAGKRDFTPEEVDAYAHSTCGEPYDVMLHDAVARTDGRARELMIAKFSGGFGRNQAEIVADPNTPPIAILNGADEPFVNVEFVDAIPVGNLWDGRKHLIEKSGHAPFWDSPKRFDQIFARFLQSLEHPWSVLDRVK